jgi:hypothetical protein
MTLLKGVLHQCGIEKFFSAYSFKHAVCKFLIDSGCSEAEVDEAARWKQKSKSSMAANHYAYTSTMKRIHLLIAKAADKYITSSKVINDNIKEEIISVAEDFINKQLTNELSSPILKPSSHHLTLCVFALFCIHNG